MDTLKKRRVVFVNLHGNEFLVKTLNKIVFGQSVAVKHRYLLDYLLGCDDIEVCTYINERGLSLSYTTRNPLLQSFRFIEHKIAMRKNGIPLDKITVLKKESEIRPDDIVVSYSYYGQTQLVFSSVPDAVRVICQIHFGTQNSAVEQKFTPHAMYNESDLRKYSGMWRRDLPWFDKIFITIPFVFETRFKRNISFDNRKNKAVSVGTITYMYNITDYYGDSCAQPARKNCRFLAQERPDLIDSFNFDYLENQQSDKQKTTRNPLIKTYRRLKAKITGGHQKQYYSFNMVDKLNSYKIAVVGEEIMGIPGIGFVEAMACGCAFIGQNIGYYEDYGMIDGIHYIAYDGSKEDLVSKIEYWIRPENADKLKRIAEAGHEFVTQNFNKDIVAKQLVDKLLALKK